jgi:class 3 adenylate cyclase
MPVCQRCGEDNPERARFCLACATPLTAPPVARREERKRVSVLFCDLVGFTSRSERLDIEDVRGLLAPTTPACGPTWNATAGRWRSSSATP